MNNSERKKFSPEEKFKIVKEVLTTDSSISNVCQKYQISPGVFYRWQEVFFQGALEGLQRKKDKLTKAELRKIESLEKENRRMKDVISEVTSENITLKKSLGEL